MREVVKAEQEDGRKVSRKQFGEADWQKMEIDRRGQLW